MFLTSTSTPLNPKGNQRVSIACGHVDMTAIAVTSACEEIGQSTNCQAATALRGRRSDTRMKPDWLNDSQAALTVAGTEGSYLRSIVAPATISRDGTARTGHNATAISGEKGESRIRKSDMSVVVLAKWRLPKSRRPMAMSDGSENLIWQRSFRSSLSDGKPRTWRREAVGNLNIVSKEHV